MSVHPNVCRSSSLLLLLLVGGCAAVQQTLPGIIGLGSSGDKPLTEETVAAGLKEALRVGTERTVAVTGKEDGFFGNELIRIALPEQIDPLVETLRTLGLGGRVDGFERAMNRSAELAAGEAKALFWETVTGMTLADAFGILNGGETAATDYFRDRTSGPLRDRFTPIVQDNMNKVGIYQTYGELVRRYEAIPLVEAPAFDLDAYITQKTLDGLFTVLADEERRIRADPVARTTDLLRRVFGS